MNQKPNFPLPYCNSEADSEMRTALSLIRTVQEALSRPHFSICSKHDLDSALSTATEILEPVLNYLESDERPESLTLFKDARRRRILEYGGQGETELQLGDELSALSNKFDRLKAKVGGQGA